MEMRSIASLPNSSKALISSLGSSAMMIRVHCFLLAILSLSLGNVVHGQETVKGNETIWQTKPGNEQLQWEGQVLHMGNSYFGVSAYGGVKREVMTLSEKTFWTGGPGDDTNYNFLIVPEKDLSYVGEIRRLTAEGRFAQADSVVAKHLCNESWTKLGGLSTIGSLVLNFEGHDGEIHGYERCLDLKRSILTVKYNADGVYYTREYFCSYPDRILAMRLTADKPHALSFSLGLDLMHRERQPRKTITPSTGMFEVAGNMNDNNRPYRVKIKVLSEGGVLDRSDSLLIVKGSNAITLYYSVATDFKLDPPLFRGADPDKITSDAIAKATSAGYDKVKQRHIADYQSLYNRTSLHLQNPVKERECLPTDERLGYFIYNNDAQDLGLKELAFNFGKYMLISVSRPGTMATGNQGIWNNRYQALWNGTYQLDMNVTQTYMFGNALNLSECQEPFIDYIKMLSMVGEKAARGYYGSHGWTSFIISDLWGGAGTLPPAPFLSSGWLSLILWEQYAFDQNEAYLREIYPVLKGAAQFYLENLIEYKDTKKLVFWGTYSAEHSSSPLGVTVPNFQDIAFIGETFENTVKASEILGRDKEFREKVREAKERLMPYKVGRMGQFQEWVEDIDDSNCQHRHLSHLLSLQPCKQVNLQNQPSLGNAIKVTLMQRRDNDFVALHRPDLGNSILYPTKCLHEGLPYDYYTSQAWCRAARLCTWLRVYDGDHADKIQNDIFRESTLGNMIQYETRVHYGDKPVPDIPFFIESTALAAGYVTEMVLQSQHGELELLSALPSAWQTGSMKGIRGRNACTVDIEWKNGELVKAGITSDKGGEYTIRCHGKTRQVRIEKGKTYVLTNAL
jgi:alpha-L-fucosidase 2